jgi:AsmA protein
MSRLIKVIGIIVGVLVLLVIVAAIGVSLFVDPNDYKDRITAAVAQATGRTLVLDGDLALHVFPTLRVSVGHATLGNAPGFGDEPFAEIQGAALDVRLLPLLSRRLEVGKAELRGLVLNLERDAAGKDNWQDLGGSTAAQAAPETPSAGGGSVDLNVGELDIADSQVKWSDASTGSEWTLGNFNLGASGFGPGKTFPLSMNFALKGADLNMTVDVDTRAAVSLADERYRLDDLHVKLAGNGASWPGGQGEATLDFASLIADLKAQTVDLEGLRAGFLGITASGSLKGRNLLGDLALSGKVEIAEFDPSVVLDVFGAGIKTADPSVLKRASAKATFVYGGNRIGLDDMTLALDDSSLTGSVALQNEALRFDLGVDQIDADRYLPPAEEGAAQSDEGSLDAVDLPVDVLKTIDASGKLTLGKAQFAGVALTDAALAVTAAGGHVDIKPSAKLYGGTLAGDVKLDVDGDAVKLGFAQKLAGVDMLPLGRALLQSEMISGTGSVTLNLTSAGSNVGQMRRALDGDVSFAVTDGALEGLDLWYELRRARAALNRSDTPARPEGMPRTAFSSVSASGVVKDAVLTNKDLNATTQFVKVDGSGTVNLLNDALDFDLVATVVDSAALKADTLMSDLAGQQLPLKVGGSIEAPSVVPDFAAIVKARARKELEERTAPKKEEAQKELEQKKNEAQDKLRDKLKGLLNR